MKKVIVFLCVIVLLVCLIVGFIYRSLPRPTTDLEFWIGENVDDVDFSKYISKYGLMGGHAYYGSSYFPSTDAQGKPLDPEVCVIYQVTAYPDYSSRRQHITQIIITDPSVSIYGLSLNSSFTEIERVMRNEGFSVEKSADACIARKGRFTFTFGTDRITLSVSVTNWMKIQF